MRSSSEHAHRHVLHPAWLLEWDARFRTAGAIILADIGALVCCQRPQGSRFIQPTRILCTAEAATAMRETRCMSVVVFVPSKSTAQPGAAVVAGSPPPGDPRFWRCTHQCVAQKAVCFCATLGKLLPSESI